MKYLAVILLSLFMLANCGVVLAEEFAPPEAPPVPDYVEGDDGSSGVSPSNGGGGEPSNDGNNSSQAVDVPASNDEPDSSTSSSVPIEPTNPIEEPSAPEPDEEPVTDEQDIYLEGEEPTGENSAVVPENENEGNPEIGTDISTLARVVVFIGGSIGAIEIMRKLGHIGKHS